MVTSIHTIGRKENSHVRPWNRTTLPKKILCIRLQAHGDVVITLPYLQALKEILSETKFHFLTREEFSDLPHALTMFNSVYTIAGGRDLWKQTLSAIGQLPSLRQENYDCVIDLQRNFLSRFVRRFLHPQSFVEFDRFSPLNAGERTRQTIDRIGFSPLPEHLPELHVKERGNGAKKLFSSGHVEGTSLIVLNPAGSFITRNWPLRHYVEFAKIWTERIDPKTKFLVLGVETIREKAFALKENLGHRLIDLVGQTTPSEAFDILNHVTLVLTEDSGLMHMAWAAQAPIVGLLGSSPSVWVKPAGRRVVCLDSSDLECGSCQQPTCKFGDVRCLSRFTPEMVLAAAQNLLNELGRKNS